MTADVELLPLPQWTQYNAHLRIRANSLQRRVQDYARANVAHATAAKDAEIEALRAEVARRVEGFAGRAEQLEARAERLAEALREIAEYEGHPSTPIYNSVKKSAIARAALRDHDQEAPND